MIVKKVTIPGTIANLDHVALTTQVNVYATLAGTHPYPPSFPTRRSSDLGSLGANAGTPDATFYATSGTSAALGASATAYSFGASYVGDSNYNAIRTAEHTSEL